MSMPSTATVVRREDARWHTASTGVRFGLKGSGAPAWLRDHGIDVPADANSVHRWPGGRCLRLGHGEFLVELDEADTHPPMPGPARDGGHETWMLLRSDHCVLLEGRGWLEVLPQACSFDLQRLTRAPDMVVMTLFAGITATLVLETATQSPGGQPFALRLWCDASYATYLEHCLQQLAIPLGDAS